MKQDLNTIPVFFAVDDGYIPFLSVTIESLIDHASDNNMYEIRVLYTNISKENIEKIKKYNRENICVEFVDLSSYIENVKDKLHTRDYYTQTTYFRLFLPDLYPEYKKVLYLDSDITILRDVADLYNLDLGKNLVAAVPDGAVQTVPIFKEYVEKVVGLADYNNYFNAGILLMNLEELREFKFQEKFLYLLQTVKYKVAQDQDYLNRLCKGRTRIIANGWNAMPMEALKLKEEDLYIIHYNLGMKPWHHDNILYEEYFWKYAIKTEYYDEIMKIKNNYTEEQRFNDAETTNNLIALAKKESDCVGDDRIQKREGEEALPSKSKERVRILEKIEQFEREGRFDQDVEEDPETIILTPENIDYLRKRYYSKIKSKVANTMAKKFLKDILRDNKLIIKDIRGLENMQNIKTGALITCNHFNPFDAFAVESVFRTSGQHENKKLYKVIREGNYTNFPGLYGFFFRNCDTLPLSSNKRTMMNFTKAVDTILQRGDFVLIYPERSMWWNYRKPKPLKDGAFHFAAKNNVPVLPIFITMEDSNFIGEDGFPIQEYTINIEKPIYPNLDLSKKENIQLMRDANYEVWKNVYEEFYKIPLEYTTKVPIEELG